MADTEIDWTFDDIPTDEAAATERPAGPRRTPTPHHPTDRRLKPPPGAWLARLRRHRRLLLVLAALLAVGATAAGTAYAIGWQQLRAQLTHEIVYEDEQARAGNVEAVLALHSWASEPWRQRRRAEVALGLAAPLPADTLRPAATSPVLLALDSPADRTFTAVVARQFTDSAGQVVTFTLTQRYRNLGPGLWERQPPDQEALNAAIDTWTGARLSATYPAADAAWMQTALPQVDAYLSEACALWQCLPAARVAVTFTTQLDQLPRLRPLRTAAEAAAAPPAGYPAIFDLPFRNPRYPSKIVLASPQLAGQPADEAATQALIRAYTADFLGQLAADVVVSSRTQHRYFLDVLVARMEVRLGLSAMPPRRVPVSAYLPVTTLWSDIVGNAGSGRPPELAPRLQGLWFLDHALAGRPPTAEGDLLAHMRWQTTLAGWLNLSLGLDGDAAVAAYEAELRAQWAATAPDWAALEGLLYSCGETLARVQGGGPVPLPWAGGGTYLTPEALSPNGRYLAVAAGVRTIESLQVLDLTHHTVVTLTTAPGWNWPLGWSADNRLVYITPNDAGSYSYDLHLYDPATALSQPVPGGPFFMDAYHWSADHRALAFTLTTDGDSLEGGTRPAVLTFDGPATLLQLNVRGHAPALSPDGRWLAYAARREATGDLVYDEPAVTFIELDTAVIYEAQLPSLLPSEGTELHFGALLWSPDGTRLAFTTQRPGDTALHLLTLRGATSAGGADLETYPLLADVVDLLSFSADSRYVSARHFDGSTSALQLLVFDTATGAVAADVPAYWPVWSPQGHQLVLSGAAGLYTLDVETGAEQFIAGDQCSATWPAP